MSHVLITGGAGFIGSHLADALLEAGHTVRVLDNLDPQVHGGDSRPAYLHDAVELQRGDVRDRSAVSRALDGVDRVCHLAAAVGVGQSMYQIDRYTSVNDLGTATLLQALSERGGVERLVVASSMSIYGEGQYANADGEVVTDAMRTPDDLRAGRWELRDRAGRPLVPVPTSERKPVALSSVYAITKYVQERLAIAVGAAYGIPTIALRFFNVYGPHQALSNPYTGVLAIFAARLLNGRPPMVFEDGRQCRDFVHVEDVARACVLALDAPADRSGVFNVGSGQPVSIADVARRLAAAMDRPDIAPEITGRFRMGDIRHCFADVMAAKAALGFTARVPFDAGLVDLVGWLRTQHPVDRLGEATDALAARGLTA
jgi:dTDP-L-rhamnose 4-epimerase